VSHRFPVDFSPTHCPHTVLDFSLKDFPPTTFESVLTLLPLPRVRFFITHPRGLNFF
jgi:hypothetical protein